MLMSTRSGEGVDEVQAAQLAYHFYQAQEYSRAFKYSCLAAERSARIYANDEAIQLYTRAIELTPKVLPDAMTAAKLHRGRGLSYEFIGEFELSRADYEKALQISRTVGENQIEWQILLDLGKLWTSRDYQQSHAYYAQSLKLAHDLGDPLILATSLNWMGNWHLNAENPLKAIEFHRNALEIFERIGEQRNLAATLDLLGIASELAGDCPSSVRYFDRSIAIFRELDDRSSLASSLTGRGNIGGAAYSALTVVPAVTIPDARCNFEEAIQIAREIGSRPTEAWVLWSFGILSIVEGNFGRSLEATQNGLRIASEIEHREGWGCQSVLGLLYVSCSRPRSLPAAKNVLVLAKELNSQHWIHQVTGTLAAAYVLQGDLPHAQACLETVISPETPMDTLHKRYCWARRAELALYQGNPTLALEITERLIISTPALSPGNVIPFLWKLKGEALAASGHIDEAIALLRAAEENAQETGERFLQWRIHASLGHFYRSINDPVNARKEFATSRALIGKIASSISVEGLKDKFIKSAYFVSS